MARNGKNNGKSNVSEKQRVSKEAARQRSNANLRPFQSGQSGNPNGRPPGKSWLQAHREVWDKPADDRALRSLANVKFGDDRAGADKWLKEVQGKMTFLEAISQRDVYKAFTPSGDFMVKTMWEQNDGRPTLKIVGPDDGPLQVQQVDYKNLSTDELKLLRELIAKATTKENGDEG
jgi:hypothetical protein